MFTTRFATRTGRVTASTAFLVAAAAFFPAIRPATAQIAPPAWPAEWVADSAFYSLWSKSDGPVAAGSVTRSWLWGPLPFAVANESYAESSTGTRLVQYFDKGRMEINDPAVDRSMQWFVTSGLLVNEMVTGQMQTGNSRFESASPAGGPVAGDVASPIAPTYASFASYTVASPDQTGKPVSQKIAKNGSVSSYAAPGDPNLTGVAQYDATSHHNIPRVFTDWMAQSGTIYEAGRFVQDQLLDPLFVLGHPITDAYWADILVNGAPTTVLVQLFERRALTYNPGNPLGWRVEMANIGRAYYDWRYSKTPPGPALAAELAGTGILLRGWNWPGPATVAIRIVPGGGGNPVAGPANVGADASGRFALQLPYNQAVRDTLQSGGKLAVVASTGSANTALPLAGRPPTGNVHVEGTITQVETTAQGTRFAMQGLDGKGWRFDLGPAAVVSGAEGRQVAASTLDAGDAAVVEGSVSQGLASASTVRLMSVSGTGSNVGYEWSADGSVSVSGTGWPSLTDVVFAAGPSSGPQGSFGKLKANSEGSVTGSIKPPGGMQAQVSLWLFASAAGGGGVGAQVVVPVLWLGSPGTPAVTQLHITTRQGSEEGGLGSYCTGGKCFQSAGVPVSADGLSVKAGDVLGLHEQSGANGLTGETPSGIAVQIYRYPSNPAVAPPDGGVYFTSQGIPLFATGDQPGRPFSVSIPPTLAPGKYVVVLTVSWPDSGGGKNNGVYGFAVQVL